MTLNGKIDWLWPSLSPRPKCYDARLKEEMSDLDDRVDKLLQQNQDDAVRRVIDPLLNQIASENERSSGTNAKLTSILAFLPISVSIIVALLAVTTTQLPENTSLIQKIVTTFSFFITLYVFSQVVLACKASLSGIERRNYPYIGPDAALPKVGESQYQFHSRRSKILAASYLQIREINNTKVSQVAVAHRAISNALVGFLLLCAAMGCFLTTIIVSSPIKYDVTPQYKQVQSVEVSIDTKQDTTGITSAVIPRPNDPPIPRAPAPADTQIVQ